MEISQIALLGKSSLYKVHMMTPDMFVQRFLSISNLMNILNVWNPIKLVYLINLHVIHGHYDTTVGLRTCKGTTVHIAASL